MSINLRRYAISLAVFVAATIVLVPSNANAQEAEQTDNAAATAQQSEDYKFVTPAGGSLSELVRRALQLFDASNNDLNLSEPQAMFAEASIVNNLGPRLLEIGEEISVPVAVIEQFTAESQSLSEPQQANWKVYSDNADFETVSTIVAQTLPTSTIESTNESTEETTDANTTEESTNDSSSSNWWWVVAVAAIAGIVYFMVPGIKNKQ